MRIEVGNRLRSVACDTQVIVVGAPAEDVELTCGGHPMVPVDVQTNGRAVPVPHLSGGTRLGKRYGDGTGGLVLLVTRAGEGTLAIAGQPLEVLAAKPLPSSD